MIPLMWKGHQYGEILILFVVGLFLVDEICSKQADDMKLIAECFPFVGFKDSLLHM